MSSKRKGDSFVRASKSYKQQDTNEEKTYKMMHNLPLDLVHEVATFMPRQNCAMITAHAKKCENATIYKNQNGVLKDCSLYCIRHMNKWMPEMLLETPNFLVMIRSLQE